MIKDIVKDTEKLSERCKTVTTQHKAEVEELIQDMLDTAKFHEEKSGCIGLAANQIGSNLRVILVRIYGEWVPMINPVIVKKSNITHISEEGCLSLEGVRHVKRYCKVTVLYKTQDGKQRKLPCGDIVADCVQHEIDHLNGKLI